MPAGAAPTGRPAVSGTEHFQLMTTSATATSIPVIAYGVFTAAGVNHTGSKVDTLVFPNGSFKINHSGVPTRQKFNKKTCLLQVSGTGKVTLFGGTGAYKGISGKPVASAQHPGHRGPHFDGQVLDDEAAGRLPAADQGVWDGDAVERPSQRGADRPGDPARRAGQPHRVRARRSGECDAR